MYQENSVLYLPKTEYVNRPSKQAREQFVYLPDLFFDKTEVRLSPVLQISRQTLRRVQTSAPTALSWQGDIACRTGNDFMAPMAECAIHVLCGTAIILPNTCSHCSSLLQCPHDTASLCGSAAERLCSARAPQSPANLCDDARRESRAPEYGRSMVCSVVTQTGTRLQPQ